MSKRTRLCWRHGSQVLPRDMILSDRGKGLRTLRVLEGDTMLKAIAKFQVRRVEERGATAVEYGLMVALIAVVIIAAVGLLGTNLSNLFSNVASKV